MPRALTLGRASSNDFVVNDATVSREHLKLIPSENDGWLVEVCSQASPVELNGNVLPLGAPTRLLPNAELKLGEIRITFHDVEGFTSRVEGLAAKAAESAQ